MALEPSGATVHPTFKTNISYICDMKARKSKKDPCWDGHEMVGMKSKGGKSVPNCVPVSKKKS